MLNKDWAPDESSAAIFAERCVLAGWFLGAVGFGVHLTLFIWCFHLLYFKKKQPSDWFHLVYICLLFILGNIGNGTTMKYAEVVYIDGRNYPGGPSAIYAQQSSSLIVALSNSVYTVNTWLQDGLLLYRTWIILNGNWYILALPALMYLASVAIAIVLIVELSHPNSNLWSKTSINLAIPTWSLSIALNVVLTSLIVARLMYTRYRLRRLLGTRGSDYLSITAMLIESAALFTINGLWFIIPYALNSPIEHLALPLLGQTQSIAPLLVILRVLQGRAWSKTTRANLNNSLQSGIDFRKPDLPATRHNFGGRYEESTIGLGTIGLETTRDTDGGMTAYSVNESDADRSEFYTAREKPSAGSKQGLTT